MHPEALVKEEKMMDHIEAWEADLKVVEQQPDFQMKPNHKLIALEIMFVKYSNIFEAIERAMPNPAEKTADEKFEWMLNALKIMPPRKDLKHSTAEEKETQWTSERLKTNTTISVITMRFK